jgi:BatD DUF11 like domain
MHSRISKWYLFILSSLQCITLVSQNFTASVNQRTVEIGQFFQLAFSINANASNFTPPDFKDFDVYSGPNQSTSMSFINGVMSSSMSLSYYLIPKKAGTFTIGPAKITANGKQLQSNTVTIEVTKGNGTMANGNQNGNVSSQNQVPAVSSGGSGDVFIRTSVSKTHCYVGEQLNVKQKIYSLHQMKGFQNYKAPSYTGFWSKEEERSAQLTQRTENVEGKTYFVVEFNSTILFPQRSGKLSIDPVQIDVMCAVQNRNPRSLMEQFFGGGYEDKQFTAKSKKTEIDVEAVPEQSKPNNYNGAVGNYTFKAEINKNTIKENEAINLKMVISGKGNINLIDAPSVEFPAEFETYDPKISENVTVGSSVSGTKTYDYLLIPRKKGQYILKNFGFSYFDPEKKQYVSIPSPELVINVEQGDKNSSVEIIANDAKNEIEDIQNDIRYIKKENLKLIPVNKEFFGSTLHYGILSLLIVVFLCVIGLIIHQKKTNQNTVLLMERKAIKNAKKQLVNAAKLLRQNDKEKFYNEILTALNQYISNRFNIPVSELSREKIKIEMASRKVDEITTSEFVSLMDSCEYVKYAPGNLPNDLPTAYDSTLRLITSIEKQLKS